MAGMQRRRRAADVGAEEVALEQLERELQEEDQGRLAIEDRDGGENLRMVEADAKADRPAGTPRALGPRPSDEPLFTNPDGGAGEVTGKGFASLWWMDKEQDFQGLRRRGCSTSWT